MGPEKATEGGCENQEAQHGTFNTYAKRVQDVGTHVKTTESRVYKWERDGYTSPGSGARERDEGMAAKTIKKAVRAVSGRVKEFHAQYALLGAERKS